MGLVRMCSIGLGSGERSMRIGRRGLKKRRWLLRMLDGSRGSVVVVLVEEDRGGFDVLLELEVECLAQRGQSARKDWTGKMTRLQSGYIRIPQGVRW